ncbi:hypothetical protein KIL84_014937 [Mauremys mutica]|uniref:Uncharacterized protein n=1 Tax=Mauremys mutica TaxID=74926 RepID=A0A9D4B845_9SAUR|nr:hypothetical protein KIL84_014937 [Mauremys mutica]
MSMRTKAWPRRRGQPGEGERSSPCPMPPSIKGISLLAKGFLRDRLLLEAGLGNKRFWFISPPANGGRGENMLLGSSSLEEPGAREPLSRQSLKGDRCRPRNSLLGCGPCHGRSGGIFSLPPPSTPCSEQLTGQATFEKRSFCPAGDVVVVCCTEDTPIPSPLQSPHLSGAVLFMA